MMNRDNGHEIETLDRDDDLEVLLRATLHGRAAGVHDGPAWAGAGRRIPAARAWPAVAAAVVLVLALAGGFALWRVRSDDSTAAGGGPRAVQVPLPAAWRTALHPAPLRSDGRSVQVQAMTASGSVIGTVERADRGTDVVSSSAGGTTRTLYTVPAPSLVLTIAADDRWTVIGTAPDTNQRSSAGILPQVIAVDQRTAAARVLSTSAVLPRGYAVADGDVAINDGRAYWAAVPAARAGQTNVPNAVGRIVAYDLNTRRSSVVAHASRLTSGATDPRGVYWPGGSRPAQVPAVVASFSARLNHYREADHNGTAWAWDQAPDGRTVGWTDGSTVRRWSTDVARIAHGDLTTVQAVVGPYVFLVPMNGGNSHVFVLDTRTGVYADGGIEAFPMQAAGQRVAMYTRATGQSPYETVVLDTSGLPGLHR